MFSNSCVQWMGRKDGWGERRLERKPINYVDVSARGRVSGEKERELNSPACTHSQSQSNSHSRSQSPQPHQQHPQHRQPQQQTPPPTHPSVVCAWTRGQTLCVCPAPMCPVAGVWAGWRTAPFVVGGWRRRSSLFCPKGRGPPSTRAGVM